MRTTFSPFAILQSQHRYEYNLLVKKMNDNTDRKYDQHEAGAKNDMGKMDLSLLQLLPNALLEVSRVMDYGQNKYTRGGFLFVIDAPKRYTSAMLRHWFKEAVEKFDTGDPFYNTEKGAPFKGTIRHDAQVAVNALFRLECTMREEQMDDELISQAKQTIIY